MISLLLSIVSSTIILIIFKIIERQKVDIFPPIVVNYIAASALGFTINRTSSSVSIETVTPWILISIVIGIMLIGNFYLIGNSTQKAGIGITTVAAKMSFVLPVLYSLIFDAHDIIDIKKTALILLALASVFFVIYPKKFDTERSGSILYPILIFFGLGLLDTLLKYCQHHFITDADSTLIFTSVNFTVAGIIGIAVVLFSKKSQKQLKNPKVWLIGIALGVANFGSMYFLINSLNALRFDNSLVFGINNIGIVIASVLIAIIIYKERFSKINWLGLILSLLVLLGMINILV
ncbi:MAG: hypothetical protein PF517_01025 [Salinivirgaceae bacterium]|jgi:drug/metabolite transporter (DMT)-like permease|nr:hypothetical protein [Salinivirgaceae bacterium]